MVALALLAKGTTQEFVLIVIHQVLMLELLVLLTRLPLRVGWMSGFAILLSGNQKYREGLGTDEINLVFFRLTGSSVRL